MSEKVSLQVKLDPDVLQKLKMRAQELGFSTTQAYVRFWAASETSEKSMLCERNDAESQAVRYIVLVLSREKRQFRDVDQALVFVSRHIARYRSHKFTKQAGLDMKAHPNPRK